MTKKTNQSNPNQPIPAALPPPRWPQVGAACFTLEIDMATLQLRGGPLDGAEIPAFGWVEAIAVRTDSGVHWYVYTGCPPEAEAGHTGLLFHHTDDTSERVAVHCDAAMLANLLKCHRLVLASQLRFLGDSVKSCLPEVDNS